MHDRFAGLDWITPYGVMLTLACVVAWWLSRRRAAAAGLDPSHIDLALPLAFIGGALCARLLVVVMPHELLIAGPGLAAESRLRLYAVAFAGLPILLLYCLLAGLQFRRMADVVALPALAWLAVLRVGCFLAGCCFGDVHGHADRIALVADPRIRHQIQTVPLLNDVSIPWTLQFPAGSFAYRQHEALGLLEPDAAASLPVHPVQLYEIVVLGLLAWLLLRLRPRLTLPGSQALAAFGGYAGAAFMLEFLRADNALELGLLTGNQLICIGWLAVAALLLVMLERRARR